MKQFTGYKKGINLGGWLSQCDHSKAHYDSFLSEDDIRRISSWGLDHVRLPVDYELIETEQGDSVESGFQYIDSCLQWCEKYGLNMILDLHKARGYFFNEVERSLGFFEDAKLQEDFISLWEQFAIRYEKYSDRLAFELLNEVVDRNVAAAWNRIAERTVKAIRKHAPSISILLGGVEYNSISALKMLPLPFDEHIVYNFHFYDPLIFTHQSAYWIKEMPSNFSTSYPNELAKYLAKSKENLPEGQSRIYSTVRTDQVEYHFIENSFSEAVRVAEERGVPLYCGEYGVIDQADIVSTLNWYTDVNRAFEKFGIGRAAWTYKEKDFGLLDKHYAPIFNQLIKLL